MYITSNFPKMFFFCKYPLFFLSLSLRHFQFVTFFLRILLLCIVLGFGKWTTRSHLFCLYNLFFLFFSYIWHSWCVFVCVYACFYVVLAKGWWCCLWWVFVSVSGGGCGVVVRGVQSSCC